MLFIDVMFITTIISLTMTMKIVIVTEQVIFYQGISNYLAFVNQFNNKSYLEASGT